MDRLLVVYRAFELLKTLVMAMAFIEPIVLYNTHVFLLGSVYMLNGLLVNFLDES